MKNNKGLIVALIVFAIVTIFISIADQFADKPTVFVRGKIQIEKELIEKAQGINTLFIIVYDADNQMPMPYGAIRQRIKSPNTTEVEELIITPERLQVMRPEIPFPNNVKIKVRLDVDGNGGTDNPGDLVGELDKVAKGSENVTLKIDKAI